MSTAPDPTTDLERRGIAAIRALAMDAPHRAGSGHQGTAMALAPLAHVLFTRVLRYDAADPSWPDRDRFVLSGGHASILLYSLLHLTGQGLELEDLRQFRQWGSATPGHPEVGHTAGVEVTTGPLGQGFANAVGLAVAERRLRATFGTEVCDHHTFVVCGDGDLSEGISHEAASLAGHLGLGRLVAVYDDNHITIDGPTELALNDDVTARFEAYGWHVIELGEQGENLDAIEQALVEGRDTADRPTLIRLRTRIGYPSPGLTDDHRAHGNPFDDAEIAATKAVMGVADEPFAVPADVLAYYRAAGARGAEARAAWTGRVEHGVADSKTWQATMAGVGLEGWEAALPTFEPGASVATRKASQACVTALADVVPGLIGGAADLTGNTGTDLGDEAQSRHTPAGRQINFGVREHAMAAIAVGAAAHGGAIPLVGTFLVFSDYMRPAVRLAAMSSSHCVFVWTHDSVGVGEDGPTHQPIEHVMALRAVPGLTVLRPADAVEVTGAWRFAIGHDGPVAMILSRQNLPVLAGSNSDAVGHGAYAVVDHADPDVVLVGTGSEVSVCVEAAARLDADGVACRVVSLPSWELFAARPAAERDAVLPADVPTVSVEAGVTLGWDRYADVTIGIDRFGASAPGAVVLDRLGINPGNVVAAVTDLLSTVESD